MRLRAVAQGDRRGALLVLLAREQAIGQRALAELAGAGEGAGEAGARVEGHAGV